MIVKNKAASLVTIRGEIFITPGSSAEVGANERGLQDLINRGVLELVSVSESELDSGTVVKSKKDALAYLEANGVEHDPKAAAGDLVALAVSHQEQDQEEA